LAAATKRHQKRVHKDGTPRVPRRPAAAATPRFER
jgi:hypothetical protein